MSDFWDDGEGSDPSEWDADEAYDYMRESLGVDDPYSLDLLWHGWFDSEMTPEERMEARDTFFEYEGLDTEDFDWDAWRDWMGYE